jgi:hypothetical protein
MPETEKPKRLFSPFSVFAITIFLATIASNFYFFYFKKNYDFIVESPCDPSKEQCFERDCSNPNDCPANGFFTFKRYSLKASDFKFCENENCIKVCEDKQIECEQIECVPDPEFGESCTLPVLEPEKEAQGE